mgnify:FL=1
MDRRTRAGEAPRLQAGPRPSVDTARLSPFGGSTFPTTGLLLMDVPGKYVELRYSSCPDASTTLCLRLPLRKRILHRHWRQLPAGSSGEGLDTGCGDEKRLLKLRRGLAVRRDSSPLGSRQRVTSVRYQAEWRGGDARCPASGSLADCPCKSWAQS